MSDSDERESAEEEKPMSKDQTAEADSPPPKTTDGAGCIAKTADSLKAASGRIVAELRKLKLKTVDLRGAYLRLGRDAYEQRLTNDELSERFTEIESVTANIASLDSDIESYNEHRLAQICTPKVLSVVAIIFFAWFVWSLIPPGTIITAPTYAHLKSRIESSQEALKKEVLTKHGVENLDDLPKDEKSKAIKDSYQMAAKVFAEVTPPSVGVDDSASEYVTEVKCGNPEPGGTILGSYLSFPITLTAKQALSEYGNKLSFKAYDPSDVIVDTGDLSLRQSASQGDKIEVGASLSGEAIWRVYRFKVFYGERTDAVGSSDTDGG